MAFTAAPQAQGFVKLTYVLTDGSGSDEGEVIITVQQCSESPPSARNGTAFTPYMTPINVDLTELVDSGNIVAGSVSGAGLSGPTGVYTPPANMNGTETVTFTVANGCRQTHEAQLVIDVNHTPVVGSNVNASTSAGAPPMTLTVDDLASDDEALTIVDLTGNPGWVTCDATHDSHRSTHLRRRRRVHLHRHRSGSGQLDG